MYLITQVTVPAVITGCLGASTAILANVISFIMIGKINERVEQNDRISYLWWGSAVRTRFKRLYPGNKLVLFHDLCVALMIVCFVLLIRFWVFG